MIFTMFEKFIKNNTLWILLGIFLITLFLRIYKLGDTPYGLHNDEIANTYGTRFIFLNGQDIYGNKWPLIYLDKFGDYPPILPMYLSGLGTFLFGNDEFGSRALIAIVGSLMMFPIYFIVKTIFKRVETALFSALLFAILPVHIMLSRLNAEGIVALTVFVTAIALLLHAIVNNKYKIFIGSLLLLLFTYLLYPSLRIVVPLASVGIIVLVFIYKLPRKFLISAVVFTILSFLTTIYISSTYWGKGRFDQTSIFSTGSGVEIQIQQLIFNEKNILIARIFNNKIIGYGYEFIYQYFSYFDLNYLFGTKGRPILYTLPHTGLLFLSIIPLLIISLISYFQTKNKGIQNPFFVFIIYLLLISPIPAALTVADVPNIHRSLLLPILFIVLASYGFNSLYTIKLFRIPLQYICLFIIGLELIFFTHTYFTHVSFHTSVYRNDGNKELVNYLMENKNKYDAIYVTSKERWLPSYYLFYSNDYNPNYIGKFKNDFRLDNIDNIHFIEADCPTHLILDESKLQGKLSVPQNTLFIDDGECKFKLEVDEMKFTQIDDIKRVNFTTAFLIKEINSKIPFVETSL